MSLSSGEMTSSAKHGGRQDVVITVLLVLAGIALAICLFAAGLFWRGKPTTKGTARSGAETRCNGNSSRNEEEKCERPQIHGGVSG